MAGQEEVSLIVILLEMLIITQFSDIGSHHGHDISTPEGVGIVDDRSQLITRFFGLHSGKEEERGS